jgi:hypothetical protein
MTTQPIQIGQNLDFENAARILNLPTPVNGGDAVNRLYVDGLISASLKPPQPLDCSTNPDYPTSTQGDTYIVTVAGLIGGNGGIAVNIGDLVGCRTTTVGGTQSSVGVNFFILESNRDQATETILGVVRLATQTEVNTGSAAQVAVTPATLQTKLTNTLTETRYTTTVGNGTNNSFTITHGLNEARPQVTVSRTASPSTQTFCGVEYIDANNISVGFINPPTTNQYTVSIRK